MTLPSTRSGDRYTIVQPGMNAAYRWPLFLGVAGILGAVLWSIGFWPLTLLGGAIVLYLSAGVCFNRTIVEVDPHQLSWRQVPFPLRPPSRLPLAQVHAWLFGPLAQQTEAFGRSAAYSFAVAAELPNEVVIVLPHLDSRDEARACAQELARITKRKAHARESLQNSRVRALLLVLALVLATAILLALVLPDA